MRIIGSVRFDLGAIWGIIRKRSYYGTLIYENDITVIDVMEDHEIEICSEKQFIHIKMNEIPNKTKELDKKLRNFDYNSALFIYSEHGIDKNFKLKLLTKIISKITSSKYFAIFPFKMESWIINSTNYIMHIRKYSL